MIEDHFTLQRDRFSSARFMQIYDPVGPSVGRVKIPSLVCYRVEILCRKLSCEENDLVSSNIQEKCFRCLAVK
jgi:hypothetical protein